jgi:hypothetical protein
MPELTQLLRDGEHFSRLLLLPNIIQSNVFFFRWAFAPGVSNDVDFYVSYLTYYFFGIYFYYYNKTCNERKLLKIPETKKKQHGKTFDVGNIN